MNVGSNIGTNPRLAAAPHGWRASTRWLQYPTGKLSSVHPEAPWTPPGAPGRGVHGAPVPEILKGSAATTARLGWQRPVSPRRDRCPSGEVARQSECRTQSSRGRRPEFRQTRDRPSARSQVTLAGRPAGRALARTRVPGQPRRRPCGVLAGGSVEAGRQAPRHDAPPRKESSRAARPDARFATHRAVATCCCFARMR